MIQRIKNALVVLASLAAVAVVPVLAPATVSAAGANIQGNLCSGSNLSFSSQTSGCDATASNSKFNTLLTQVVNVFSIIVGIVAVIMIIVGGLRYITSGGESSNVSTAKNTIIFALVGLVIVALAQFIVHFVLGKVGTLAG